MMETLSTGVDSPIKFTNKAVKEINRLMEEESFDNNKKLRVGVKGGGVGVKADDGDLPRLPACGK